MTPKCVECEYMKNIGRWGYNMVGFKCRHPYAPRRDFSIGGGDPAIIGHSRPREDVPRIKTSPRWCPRREEIAK